MTLWTKLGLLATAVVLLIISFSFYHCNCQPRGPAAPQSSTMTIGSSTLHVLIANTEALREQGLSDRDSLPPNTGMLFIFDPPQTPGFWMKDMKFDLDFVWINSEGQIIQIDKDISKETYPEVFWPNKAVKYVLEVPAGFVQGHEIDTDSLVYFNL